LIPNGFTGTLYLRKGKLAMDTDTQEIFDYLEYISASNGVVSLVGTSPAGSIGLKALITSVDRGKNEIEILSLEGEGIPFSPSDHIVLNCVLFPRPVRARAGEVWHQTQAMTLNKLSYGSASMGSRSQERVQPKGTLEVGVTRKGGSQYTAVVADISVEGVSLSFDAQSFPHGQVFKPEEAVNIQLDLSSGEEPLKGQISLSAEVVYVNPMNANQRFRVGFRMHPDERETLALRRYIFDRQTEIYNALNAGI
jgi:hypothetical protein